jgi:hypothetical protein
LTNAQKLQLLDKVVRAYVMTAAEHNRDRKAADTAASSDDQSLE